MKISKFPEEVTEELAEEVGWHIGDGSMNYYMNRGRSAGIYQLRGHIEDDKAHYIERIKPFFKELYGVDISLREMPSTRVFGFQIWSDGLVDFKQKLGLPLGPKLEVKIPAVFLKDNKLKVAVIRGIFDTDGCVYLQKKNGNLYPRLEIFTISNLLAEQLQVIFMELGFSSTKYLDKGKSYSGGNKRAGYKVNVRGVEMFHKFIQVISPRNPKHIAKYKLLIRSFK